MSSNEVCKQIPVRVLENWRHILKKAEDPKVAYSSDQLEMAEVAIEVSRGMIREVRASIDESLRPIGT